jgi:thiol:disulfide interchange protein
MCRIVLGLAVLAGLATAGGAAAQDREPLPQFQLPGDFAAPGLGGSDEEPKFSSRFQLKEGTREGRISFTIKLPPEWHVYSLTQKPGGPLKSRIQVEKQNEVESIEAFRPNKAPEIHFYRDIYGDLPVEEHGGEVTWTAPIRLAEGVDPADVKISGSYAGLRCRGGAAGQCIPVSHKFTAEYAGTYTPSEEAETEAAAASESAAPPIAPATLALMIGSGLLGGLILNLMPCVLPVIGLKVLSFAQQGGESRGRVLALNLSFSIGLLAVFMVLATLAAFAQLGWGEQFTSLTFKVFMTALVFAMALSFLGVWEIPIPGFTGGKKAHDLQEREGLDGAFFKGMFTTVLATPCSGPFLGPVFGFTLSQPPWVTYALFASVGLGMASPYIVLGVFPGLMRFLPRPGAWMETFKEVMGFVLLGTVVFLFSTINRDYYLPVLTLLVGIWFACWWIGRTTYGATGRQRVAAWLGGTASAAVIGVAAFIFLAPGKEVLPWQPWSPAALAAAKAEGKTVMVDFTADWCLTCKWNLKTAINTQDVREIVEAHDIAPLLADWTDGSEEISQALADLQSKSIPLLAIYPADRPDQPIILRDLLSKEKVIEALKEAGPSKTAQARSGSRRSRPARCGWIEHRRSFRGIGLGATKFFAVPDELIKLVLRNIRHGLTRTSGR